MSKAIVVKIRYIDAFFGYKFNISEASLEELS